MKEVVDMAVFSVKSGKLSEDEIRENQLSHEDFIWWADNLPRLAAVEENRGKYIVVVNKVGLTHPTKGTLS